jgi:hypothetical protein
MGEAVKPVYVRVQIRTTDNEPATREEVRRLYKRPEGEYVQWGGLFYPVHVHPAEDVYYLLLGEGQLKP